MAGYTRYPDPAADSRLMDLARSFKRDNPDLSVWVHTGAVWMRHEGKDLGIYTRTILGNDSIVCCYTDGRTALHAPADGAPANALEVT